MGENLTVNMNCQTACPDRHDVMCCLPPSYLGSAYVSGVWTVTKWPPGNPLTCDCRATELKQVLQNICMECIIHGGWKKNNFLQAALLFNLHQIQRCKIKTRFWSRFWMAVSNLPCSIYRPKTWHVRTHQSCLETCTFISSTVHWSRNILIRSKAFGIFEAFYVYILI